MTEELYNCECGGTFKETNIRGVKFSYKEHKDIPLEIDVIAPKCDKCGEILLNGAHTGVIDDALEETLKKRP